MYFINKIRQIINENPGKKIALFADMDGVMSDWDLDKNHDISKNTEKVFLNKRPVYTVINILKEISDEFNINMHILSACGYKNQADDKNSWLYEYASFFKKENRCFLIKEEAGYTFENKRYMKTGNIKRIMEERNYDIAIYIDDEHCMLIAAHKLLGDKIYCFHPSSMLY